jgi:phosphoenolpyruvate synthase/pyruvate phosphate dikinase
MSDFKSNEYANLIGGKIFEPDEENPMIGFVVLLVITVISTRKDLP